MNRLEHQLLCGDLRQHIHLPSHWALKGHCPSGTPHPPLLPNSLTFKTTIKPSSSAWLQVENFRKIFTDLLAKLLNHRLLQDAGTSARPHLHPLIRQQGNVSG